jgi:hypothetical protein
MCMKVKLFILLSTLFTLISLGAQDVRVSISSREGYVGLPLEYQITLTGTQKADVPELTGFDGFEVRYKGQSQSSQTSIINGKRTSSVTVQFSWELVPLREGTLNIPSLSIELEGETYQTPGGQVIVTPPQEMEGFRLVLRPESDKVYMGQTVRINMEFYVSSEVGSLNFSLPWQGEGESFSLLDSTPPNTNSNDVRQISIGDRAFYGSVSSRFEGGTQYTVLSIPLDIVPLKAGTIVLDGATVAFTAQYGSWPRTVTKKQVIPSEACSLTAERLPQEILDSPNGILLSRGDLSARASLSSPKARPGDPLTLTVTLSGLARPELSEIPSLDSFSTLGEDFSLPGDRSRPKTENNDLILTQTIRPVSVETSGVPPIDFLYFDLEKEQVKRVSTVALPLQMSSAGDVDMDDVERFGSAGVTQLRENDRGIRQNKSFESVAKGDMRGTTLLHSVPFKLTLILPPFLFFVYLMVRLILALLKKSRENINANAFKQLKKSLEGGEDSFTSFEIYLRNRLFGGRSFHRAELESQADSRELKGLAELYGQLERARYSGGEGESDKERILLIAESVERKI